MFLSPANAQTVDANVPLRCIFTLSTADAPVGSETARYEVVTMVDGSSVLRLSFMVAFPAGYYRVIFNTGGTFIQEAPVLLTAPSTTLEVPGPSPMADNIVILGSMGATAAGADFTLFERCVAEL
ncbi:MAG: hypothetical protein ETSY1_00885 [Candidatus Entotheonella factor]|uniref:Uncharacterized protein n=2 Tax=Candidatus Entotheonella TaxID=93171 RepID=W4M0L3_ENTF1|nr:MAG: hypothetical protein ETSY1_00885 [Candidatus Entotheonella factor]